MRPLSAHIETSSSIRHSMLTKALTRSLSNLARLSLVFRSMSSQLVEQCYTRWRRAVRVSVWTNAPPPVSKRLCSVDADTSVPGISTLAAAMPMSYTKSPGMAVVIRARSARQLLYHSPSTSGRRCPCALPVQNAPEIPLVAPDSTHMPPEHTVRCMHTVVRSFTTWHGTRSSAR